MVGNPVLMRANGARRGPPVRTIASIAVLALAAAGVTAAVLHHHAAQVAQPAPAQQLATQAAPAAAPVAQAAPPVVEPGPASATPAAAPHRLASNQPVTEPLHRRAARSVGGAPGVDQSAADTSATAPVNGSEYSPSASQSAVNAAATVPAPPPTPVIPAPVAPYAATPASPSPALQNPATIPQPPAAAAQPPITATPPESSPQ
jgi:hypothetical protein